MTPMDATHLLAFVMGLFVPFEFAMKRIRGLGRHFVAKLPYKPPENPSTASAEESDNRK